MLSRFLVLAVLLLACSFLLSSAMIQPLKPFVASPEQQAQQAQGAPGQASNVAPLTAPHNFVRTLSVPVVPVQVPPPPPPPSSGGLVIGPDGTGAAPSEPNNGWPTTSPFLSTDPAHPTVYGGPDSDGVDKDDPYCKWKDGMKFCI